MNFDSTEKGRIHFRARSSRTIINTMSSVTITGYVQGFTLRCKFDKAEPLF